MWQPAFVHLAIHKGNAPPLIFIHHLHVRYKHANLRLTFGYTKPCHTAQVATCNGYIRFQAPSPELEAVRAYGQVHLQDGDLLNMALFRPIGALLSDMPGQLKKLQESVPGAEKLTGWSNDFVNYVWDTSGDALNTVSSSALKLPFANHFLRYGIDEASAFG